MDVTVITVTYNSAPWIRQCLESVRAQENVQVEIVVIDNNSSDQTVRTVGDLGSGIRLIVNRENVGFGRACNQGFEAGSGRFVYMLNPDTSLEQRDGLARLCAAMDANPRWGIAGTHILKPGGEVEAACETTYPDQHRVRRDFAGLPGRLAWVLGASMFIRRDAFAQVGGFDPGFFLHGEDPDLCLRVRQAGWEIGCVADVTVRHIGFASETGVDPYQSWVRRVPGLYRFWSKHYPPKDVRRLIRRDWLRATFRRVWYGVLSRFAGRGSESWLKYRRYVGISEASRRFLRTNAPETLPPAV